MLKLNVTWLCIISTLSFGIAFQNHERTFRRGTNLFSTISIERTAAREIGQFQNWAVQCGVQVDNGFCLLQASIDGNDDWRAATSTGAAQGARVLSVPNEMILSSTRIAQEFQGFADPSLQILAQKNLQMIYPQFYLFLKLLIEFERGAESPYYPWMAALPRKWNTAVSMDDFCLSCLPPFIRSLCQVEKDQLTAFREALKAFEYLSPWAKANEELAKFVYNIVFTRAWEAPDGDYKIVPVADFLNHGYPPNVALSYDTLGNCDVIVTQNVVPGGDLLVSYGQPTNPSRFFATFGFLNQAPAVYCKLLFSNPSQELKEVGYDPAKLLFSTTDGAIAPAVWDVVLYSRLERKKQLENDRRSFYEAHMRGDEQTKAAIHGKYFKETCSALRLHVDNILAEVADLSVRTNAFDASKHPRLPLIRKHNDMVDSTFQKVRYTLERISANT